MTGVKRCPMCKVEKNYTQFSKDSNRKDGVYVYCRECKSIKAKEFRRRNPVSAKHSEIKYKYGISINEYNKKLQEQKNSCDICGTPFPGGKKKSFFIDHNHRTGEVRGLLCRNCNLFIGFAQDSTDILREAIIYLDKWGG